MTTSTRFAVNVMCADQVGLVAGFTGVIAGLGGNIEELKQSIRLGYFVITLMATFTGELESRKLHEALAAAGKGRDLAVSILPTQEEPPVPAGRGEHFILAMSGIDAPGTFAAITSCLALRHINIEDLTCHTDLGRFNILADVMVPEEVNLPALKQSLAERLPDREVSVTLMHADIFAATNRISMPRPKNGAAR